MKILVASIGHESNTFSPLPTRWSDFRVRRGAELLDTAALGDSSLAGIVDTLREAGVELIPAIHAYALPGGQVEREAFEQLKAGLLERAAEAEGACIFLHGAMVAEGAETADSELVCALREALGPGAPLSVAMDMHGNVTADWARAANVIRGYHTAPHVDQTATGVAAARMMLRMIRKGLRPAVGFVKLPLMYPGEFARTDSEPMATIMRLVAEIETLPSVLSASLIKTHSWSDVYDKGISAVVIAENSELAHSQAARLAAAFWQRRYEFPKSVESYPPDQAIGVALGVQGQPVFLSDSGDNPTAGGTADVPLMLGRLLAKGATSALVCGFFDAEAVRACIAAGVGATVSLTLGGKVDKVNGPPLPVTGRVHLLGDGEYYRGGGRAPENRATMNRVAVLSIGGVDVLLSEQRIAVTEPAQLRSIGLEPLAYKIVVMKQGYLFPELEAISVRSILALSPGATNCDLTQLPFRRVRRPIYPLDSDVSWPPL
jgi:microcystin degradation protein MlrC